MPLKDWIAKYNNAIEQQNAPRLALVVLVFLEPFLPSDSASLDLATNLRSVTELRAENFVIVCNKCAPNFSVSKAIEFFYEAV